MPASIRSSSARSRTPTSSPWGRPASVTRPPPRSCAISSGWGSDGRVPETSAPRGPLARLIDIRPGEGPALAWSWAYIFSILAAYYVLRPIRDQMGVASGLENLPWLFTATLLGMLALNVPFGFLVKTLPRARFVPLTYRFFALNILLFALALALAPPETEIWIGRVFFV